MQSPEMLQPRRVHEDTDAFTAYIPLPGVGVVGVNAFLIHAQEPVLIDTGVVGMADQFLKQIEDRIDLDDLRWVWLTHMDADHIGCLDPILDKAPNARIITTYLGMGKRSLVNPFPMERVHLLNPGERIEVGDRSLLAVKPPTFDAPETTGLFDTKSGALFSSDAFGAVLETPAESVDAIQPEALARGLQTWASIDAPWLATTDASAFARTLAPLVDLNPAVVLSSHLPPAPGMLEHLCKLVEGAVGRPGFVGPNQAALLAMLHAA